MRVATKQRRFVLMLLLVAAAVCLPSAVGAADAADEAAVVLEAPVDRGIVEVDGVALFPVRGVAALPGQRRAKLIADRIVSLARDPGFRIEDLTVVESDGALAVMAGDTRVMMLVDADAALEGVSKQELGIVVQGRIREAITAYRSARTREAILAGVGEALVATLALIVAIAFVIVLRRRLDARITERIHSRIQRLKVEPLKLVRVEDVGSAVRTALRTLRNSVIVIFVFFYLQHVLGLFPSTRWIHLRLADWIVGPLQTMGDAVLAAIPNLIFLAILIVVLRWVIKLVRLFYEALGRGTLTFGNFDPDWAAPTYKIVRLALVAFGLVVAYPYIPGSQSAAFKGISLFAGVMLSLGSSSIIANLIAGYTMIYRRAYRVGDRVRIGDVLGDVTAVRLQVTNIRTPKNEDVVVPNSVVLGSEVTNYSAYAREHGLILHTTVGIGYETPWRQVEAMLLMAAERTEGILHEPHPFVLQKQLGDFCVTYEINAHCSDAQRMGPLYSALHRNILDVFNEYNVQIMTPAYEGDPEVPKVVPKEQWYSAPAAAPDAQGGPRG
ncbi:MAG TPA: mechanosensitive ion channel [Thermoanaerobaculales bacterium]|nr:mechanosensitive ion channel [Thermoanaerobaculales bacterium]HQL30099.1 mechanosensitive ion channel [Thermoanaerobaculales bacterium]HQN94784.1 mechanosensitive ion channel [Thermoanaerobaculales bacterium]HQP43997.1 mechanosensitive ion channel [Thermoanaerobaculales bacterium]